MAKKETAEQKLLKIIEESGQAAEPQSQEQPSSVPEAPPEQNAAQAAAQAVKGSAMPQLSLSTLLGPILEVFKIKLPQGSSELNFGIKEANKLLTVVVFLILVIGVGNYFNDIGSVRRGISFNLDMDTSNAKRGVLLSPRALEEYLDRLSFRNIFQPYEKKEEEAVSVEAQIRQIEDLTKDLKLVGVSWFDSLESTSAMIENTISGTTYFLKKGEKINNVVVKEIYADRIILTHDGEDLVMEL